MRRRRPRLPRLGLRSPSWLVGTAARLSPGFRRAGPRPCLSLQPRRPLTQSRVTRTLHKERRLVLLWTNLSARHSAGPEQRCWEWGRRGIRGPGCLARVHGTWGSTGRRLGMARGCERTRPEDAARPEDGAEQGRARGRQPAPLSWPPSGPRYTRGAKGEPDGNQDKKPAWRSPGRPLALYPADPRPASSSSPASAQHEGHWAAGREERPPRPDLTHVNAGSTWRLRSVPRVHF